MENVPTVDLASLLPYQYEKLKDDGTDVRLITLLPGQLDDTIRLNITHETLRMPAQVGCHRMSLSELRATLPAGWHAHEAMGGHYLFCQKATTWYTTWTHPDPDFKATRYQLSMSVYEPQYEALSYTWGDKHDTVLVCVEKPPSSISGMSSSLAITRNLATALKYFRSMNQPRTLWVDAISINQDDESERNEQVLRMCDIYTYAQKVIVWLGPEGDGSSQALSVLEYIGQQVEICNNMGTYCRSPGATETEWYNYYIAQLPYESDVWRVVRSLFERPWFSRLWTIQEGMLANSNSILQCGSVQLSWPRFRTAAGYLYALHHLPTLLAKVRPMMYQVACDNSHLSLTNFLFQFGFRDASDDRDKIYALLGLAPQPFRDLIRPQYSRSVSEVYKDAFIAEASWSHRLEMLTLSSMVNRTIAGPSWVPDLSPSGLLSGSLQFQFSAGFSAAQLRYQDPDKLHVMGRICTTVKRVSAACNRSLEDMWEFARSWLTGLPDGPNIDKSEVQTALTKLLCGDRTRERFPQNAYPSLDLWKQYFFGKTGKIITPEPGELWVDRVDEVPRYLIELCEGALVERSLFTTEEGLIGLCPVAANIGDVVSVVLGYHSCLMLRGVLGDAYQVVGECLVPAFQDSNGLLGPLPSNWQVNFNPSDVQPVRCTYVDNETRTETFLDPRLGALNGWEPLKKLESSNPAPEYFLTHDRMAFRNTSTGEIRNSDPRLVPEALLQLGFHVQELCLI